MDALAPLRQATVYAIVRVRQHHIARRQFPGGDQPPLDFLVLVKIRAGEFGSESGNHLDNVEGGWLKFILGASLQIRKTRNPAGLRADRAQRPLAQR